MRHLRDLPTGQGSGSRRTYKFMIHTCQHGNCDVKGKSSDFIMIRDLDGNLSRYCSDIHAALGCLNLALVRPRTTHQERLVKNAENCLREVQQ